MKLNYKKHFTSFKLKLNTFLCDFKSIATWVVSVKYKKYLFKIHKLYKKQGHPIPLKEIEKAILLQYFNMQKNERPLIKVILDVALIVKNNIPIERNKLKQYRNNLCNCGSGIKYKKCCL